MSNSTTRISDLEEMDSAQVRYKPPSTQHIANEFYGNISWPPQYSNQTQGNDSSGQNYKPLNIHPNPYGHNAVMPETMPNPQASPQRGQQNNMGYMEKEQPAVAGQVNYTLENMPPQRLPSRDIPMNPVDYQQDESVQANHIPKVKLTSDYIREYEAANEQTHTEHLEKKYRRETARTLIGELQVPILIAVLYFIFQMPIVNTAMRKYSSFLAIYHEDGNFNLIGLIIKSFLFGTVFYMFHYVAEKVSDC